MTERDEHAGLKRSERDRLLDRVEEALEAGLDLHAWWCEVREDMDFEDSFRESVVLNRPDTSFGFFDEARVRGRRMPVMGNFQTMFYDMAKHQPDDQSSARLRDQVREFVLRYIMRISDFQQPRAYDPDQDDLPVWLRPFALDNGADPVREGFGFTQWWYRKQGESKTKAFAKDDRAAIVDLRRLSDELEWIVLDVNIFDFEFSYKPFGEGSAEMNLPMKESSFLVTDRRLITIEDEPEEEGILGRYGVGYAFIEDPRSGLMGYGPGQFEAAFETIVFVVFADGRIRVDMTFVSNQPERVMNLDIDPVTWGTRAVDLMTLGITRPFSRELVKLSPLRGVKVDPVSTGMRVLDVMTGGFSGDRLRLSKRDLLKLFLLKHFHQHYQTVLGSLRTWRSIPDWLNEEALPEWVRTGVSS